MLDQINIDYDESIPAAKVPVMNTWLNYHHLYYFMVIASEGSIAKAALRLRLGQPTLSAQLKQLEETIDMKLFDRSHRKLILTESGRIALEYAKEIFKTGNEMIEALNDRVVPDRIHVQLGALDSIPKHIILALSKQALAAANCTVSILEGKGDELMRELVNHRIDLMLSNSSPSSSELGSIYARSIAKLPIVICGAPKYKHLKKDFPESLSQAPFVMSTQHSKIRHDLEHFFQFHQIKVDAVAETQDTALQILMGVDGVGLIATSRPAVQEWLDKGELVELGEIASVFEELFLIATSRKIENPVSSKLMKSFSLS